MNLTDIMNSRQLITPDVLRMFGFPSVVMPEVESFAHREEAVAWCHENHIKSFVYDQNVFWFNDHEDALMFKLRWG